MSRIELVQGDITQLQVGAVVNAANRSLQGGGGVDGAIHRAAGEALKAECRSLGGCETGDAKLTNGYHLPAHYVIHTVGPVWQGGTKEEAQQLASCYRRSLEIASQNNITSLAFPCISTGVYRFPPRQAAQIALETVRAGLQMFPDIKKVIFVCYSAEDFKIYQELLSIE